MGYWRAPTQALPSRSPSTSQRCLWWGGPRTLGSSPQSPLAGAIRRGSPRLGSRTEIPPWPMPHTTSKGRDATLLLSRIRQKKFRHVFWCKQRGFGVAAGLGFEPRLTYPESGVCSSHRRVTQRPARVLFGRVLPRRRPYAKSLPSASSLHLTRLHFNPLCHCRSPCACFRQRRTPPTRRRWPLGLLRGSDPPGRTTARPG